MINEKAMLMTKVSSGIGSSTDNKEAGISGVRKEPEDTFSSLNESRNGDADSMLVALLCLPLGSRSEEV
jgi:hypothetical protein